MLFIIIILSIALTFYIVMVIDEDTSIRKSKRNHPTGRLN